MARLTAWNWRKGKRKDTEIESMPTAPYAKHIQAF